GEHLVDEHAGVEALAEQTAIVIGEAGDDRLDLVARNEVRQLVGRQQALWSRLAQGCLAYTRRFEQSVGHTFFVRLAPQVVDFPEQNRKNSLRDIGGSMLKRIVALAVFGGALAFGQAALAQPFAEGYRKCEKCHEAEVEVWK